MQIKRNISKVDISDPSNTRIYLDDGSELTHIIAVSATSCVDSISTVSLEAHILPRTGATYEHYRTKERITLSRSEESIFFENRNPTHWRRVDV